ncbi:hypothetical protein ACLIBG_13020 [Virgibacillus sp. W0181]|uniref:hypothetical protein n=1 Tax=Virgibacillus sp. W0181 TaxID=3391581 RepID=UPI003F474BDC
MKQLMFIIGMVLLIGVIIECQGTDTGNRDMPLPGDKPPDVYVEIDNEKHLAKLGTYCWGNECVDTAGPVELLEGQEPLQVQPNAPIKLRMDFSPKPDTAHVLQINGDKEMEVDIKDNRLTAPDEPGVYYYSYGVWWMDAEEENVAHGDAFYVFAVEVK